MFTVLVRLCDEEIFFLTLWKSLWCLLVGVWLPAMQPFSSLAWFPSKFLWSKAPDISLWPLLEKNKRRILLQQLLPPFALPCRAWPHSYGRTLARPGTAALPTQRTRGQAGPSESQSSSAVWRSPRSCRRASGSPAATAGGPPGQRGSAELLLVLCRPPACPATQNHMQLVSWTCSIRVKAELWMREIKSTATVTNALSDQWQKLTTWTTNTTGEAKLSNSSDC